MTPDEQSDGWLLLFDGESTFGWNPAGKANWNVANGTITVSAGDICLLTSTTQFSDYRLKVDFRAGSRTNSGVFLHTTPKPADPARDCYELNIAPPDNPFPTGSFVGRKKSDKKISDDVWHTFDVTMEGGHCNILIDGEPALEFVDSNPLNRGFIGLQHNSGKVEFKNIKLKPLGLKSIFNGQDLTGWKTYPNMKSVFAVAADGTLHVKDGPGQLESAHLYRDFVLQVDCLVNGDGLNSGIFFRCAPGERLNGYESQIHNGFLENDRSRPADYGTGGIFRRAPARRVVADDHQWFRKTIIADGPHLAVWVNGYPVTDWTDTRKSDENPRRGLRLSAGTIAIQGHDPTTDLSFRNIAIREAAERRR